MAGATAAVTAGIGALTGGFQLFQGIKQSKEAKKQLNEFDRQVLDNVYEDMQVSTVGSDLMREEAGRTTASLVDASRNAGIRGVFGAIPRIAAQNNSQNQQSQAYLDRQVQNRSQLIAGDNQRIQGMQEARDNQELAGIGQLAQTGQQNTWSGIRGVANSAIYAAQNVDWDGEGSAVQNGEVVGGVNPGDVNSTASKTRAWEQYMQEQREMEQLNNYTQRTSF